MVVVAPSADDAVAGRIRDELLSMGIAVVQWVEGTPVAEPEADPKLRAVIAVQPGGSVRAWIAGGNGEPPREQVLTATGETGEGGAREVALRAVELVRARLLEPVQSPAPEAVAPTGTSLPSVRASAPSRPRSAASSPSLPAAPTRGEEPTLALGLSPAVAWTPGLPPAPAALLGFRWVFAELLGVELLGLVPILPSALRVPEGEAKIAAGTLGLGLWFALLPSRAPLSLGLGAGASLGVVGFHGRASTALGQDASGAAGFLLPHAHLSAAWPLRGRLALRVDGLVGVATPRPLFRFVDRDMAAFGQPLLAFGVGLEASFGGAGPADQTMPGAKR